MWIWVFEPEAPQVFTGECARPTLCSRRVPTCCGENQFSNGLSFSVALRKLLCSAKGISVLFKTLNYP